LPRFQRRFFSEKSPTVARRLLGSLLVRILDGRRLSGRVVEVEAYRGISDPASHAYRGPTGRTEVMFGEPGHAYVYFSYGVHYCLNVTTEPKGAPGAVLIRALEPIEGVPVMIKNSGFRSRVELANGPGKLTRALKIDGRLNGADLVRSKELFLERGSTGVGKVGATSRIGITKAVERPWRFYIEGSRFVSRGKPSGQPQNP
jgi:DNA-3-methyladenine glycosylase